MRITGILGHFDVEINLIKMCISHCFAGSFQDYNIATLDYVFAFASVSVLRVYPKRRPMWM